MTGVSPAKSLAALCRDSEPASTRERYGEPQRHVPGRGVVIGLAIMLPIYAAIGLVFALLE